MTDTLSAPTDQTHIQATESDVVRDRDQSTPAADFSVDLSNPDTLAEIMRGVNDGTMQLAEDRVSSKSALPVTPPDVEAPEDDAAPTVDPTDTAIKEIRLKPKSPEEQTALRLYKAANGALSLTQAMEIATGKKDEPSAQPEFQEAVQTDAVSSLQAEVLRIEEELTLAGENFDSAAMAKLNIAHNKAMIQLAKAEDQAAMEAQRAAQQLESQRANSFAAANARAIELYPDAAVEGSAMWNEMKAIHQAMVDNGDPTASDLNVPVYVAQMAARSLGIAPSNVPRGPQAKKSGNPVQVRPLQGGQTAPQSAGGGQVLLNQLNTAAELDAVFEAMRKQRTA